MTFRNAGGHCAAACAVLCVLGAVGGRAASAVQMKIATVQRGDLSAIEERREVVVRTSAEWAALWKQHSPGQKPPAFDPARSMVVGVFLGSRPSGGFAVEITGVRREGPDLIVTYRESKPDPQMMVIQMLTSPFHLVRIDRDDGTVRFRPASNGERGKQL
jgi:hypothetical protein